MSRNATGAYVKESGSETISDSPKPNQSATGSPDGQKREVQTAENPNSRRLGTSTVVPSASNPLYATRKERMRPYDGDRTNKVATLTSGKEKQTDSGPASSNERDTNGQASEKISSEGTDAEDTTGPPKRDFTVTRETKDTTLEEGADEIVIADQKEMGSHTVHLITRNEKIEKDAAKIVALLPNSSGGVGTTVEIVDKSISRGSTLVTLGKEALDTGMNIMERRQATRRRAEQESSQTLPEEAPKRIRTEVGGNVEAATFPPDEFEGGNDLTGRLVTGEAEQGDVTVVVETGLETRTGIKYKEGATHTGPTDVAVYIHPDTTGDTTGVNIAGGTSNFQDLGVMITDNKEQMKGNMGVFDKNPFFNRKKKSKNN